MIFNLMSLNFAFCLLTFILGILGFIKTRECWTLYIGVAYGLFAFSHLIFMMNWNMPIIISIIRIIAYLLVIAAMTKPLMKTVCKCCHK